MKYLYKDAILISHPKSGRTWLRMIMANILKLQGEWNPKLEMVFCRHWGFKDYALNSHKSTQHKVVYLHRNPADVLVSLYFEQSKRIKHKYKGTISEFVKENVNSVLEFQHVWMITISDVILKISYEDMKLDTPGTVKKVLDFLGHKAPDSVIERSIKNSEFDKMRETEKKGGGLISQYRGRFGRNFDESDPESFRCRKGEIGGYVDYLSKEDILYIKEKMKEYA